MTDKPKQYAVEMIHVDNKFMSGVLYTPLSRVRESFDKYEELRDQMQERIEELESKVKALMDGAHVISHDYKRCRAELAQANEARAILKTSRDSLWSQHQERIQHLESELAAEREIVDRIWKQLGITTYEETKGRSIYDCIAELASKAREEALREAAKIAKRLDLDSHEAAAEILALLDQKGGQG